MLLDFPGSQDKKLYHLSNNDFVFVSMFMAFLIAILVKYLETIIHHSDGREQIFLDLALMRMK